MINNYVNSNAAAFFENIIDDKSREWVWRFIKIIRKIFPKADHWTTGGIDKNYIDIRIGKKLIGNASGSPVIFFQMKDKKTPCCFLHPDIQNVAKTYESANFENQNTDEEIKTWLNKYKDVILQEKGKHLNGTSLNPSNFELVDHGNDATEEEEETSDVMVSLQASPLNQIMFGPPGTGKTYATIDESLKILDSVFFVKNKDDRIQLKKRFDEFISSEQIRFTTFHQSFSYEDFIEGLRALTDEDKKLEYVVEPGVFKLLCDDARTQASQGITGIKKNPSIWKISINGTGENSTKTYCLDNGEARIGWGKTGDLSTNGKDSEYYKNIGSGNQGTLQYFLEYIEVGDIVICIQSAQTIDAIGVITSDYLFEEKAPAGIEADYKHVRKVNWLYRGLNLSILPLNANKVFVQKTVYSISRFTWGDLFSYLEQSRIKPLENIISLPNLKPYVFIIDEINRGNISRIFGELISLIEPSKRAGAAEALSVILPYSKKPFSVPGNVYLIGTMNTADRSLAGLDIALRRRFTFMEMPPKPALLDSLSIEGINIGQMLRMMNERIEVLLDRDHCLGHAYFMPLKAKIENNNHVTIEDLKTIFSQQILPLLQEYFFEDWERIAWVLNDLNKPEEFRFIQQNKGSIASLFGANVAEKFQLADKRWHINKSAFDEVNSYKYIIGVHS